LRTKGEGIAGKKKKGKAEMGGGGIGKVRSPKSTGLDAALSVKS